MADTHNHPKINSTITRSDDQNIQITYTIPTDYVAKTKEEVLKEIAKDTTVPGFRKGMAPIAKVEERIDPNKVAEHILSHILPHAFADSVEEHHLKPAIYPKFEAVKIDPNSDWEIKAITCELPEVKLGDYKKKIAGEIRASKIVTSATDNKDAKDNRPTDDQLISALLKNVKLNIPKILIDEEVNGRLSQLLARIEKLGLTLEGYLASIKENSESLRTKYIEQSSEAISLELILNQIAQDEKLEAKDSEVNEFIKTTGSDPKKVEKGQLDTLKRVVLRRKALEYVASLV